MDAANLCEVGLFPLNFGLGQCFWAGSLGTNYEYLIRIVTTYCITPTAILPC